jgi:hypothetical protein
VNTPDWRTSSFSGENGSCVEVAFSSTVGIRDSKKPESGHLTVPPAQWLAFLARVKS